MKIEEATNINDVKIKDCPICHGKAKIITSRSYFSKDTDTDYRFAINIMISCEKCGLKTKTYQTVILVNKITGKISIESDGAKEVIEYWNGRD